MTPTTLLTPSTNHYRSLLRLPPLLHPRPTSIAWHRRGQEIECCSNILKKKEEKTSRYYWHLRGCSTIFKNVLLKLVLPWERGEEEEGTNNIQLVVDELCKMQDCINDCLIGKPTRQEYPLEEGRGNRSLTNAVEKFWCEMRIYNLELQRIVSLITGVKEEERRPLVGNGWWTNFSRYLFWAPRMVLSFS